MKKILSLFLTMAMVLSLTACGATETQDSHSSEASESSSEVSEQETPDSSSSEIETFRSGSPETSGEEQGSNILVAYFSWADNAVLAEDVDAVASPSVIPPGNVQQLAGWVQEETGGDLFSIQVTDPYPSDWDECLARANQERGDNARPELTENVENLDQYDTVFLGYPNWWYGVPMALLTFWSRTIFPANRCTCSARTAPADWQTASNLLQMRLPTLQSPIIFSIVTKKTPLPHREISRTGLQNLDMNDRRIVK